MNLKSPSSGKYSPVHQDEGYDNDEEHEQEGQEEDEEHEQEGQEEDEEDEQVTLYPVQTPPATDDDPTTPAIDEETVDILKESLASVAKTLAGLTETVSFFMPKSQTTNPPDIENQREQISSEASDENFEDIMGFCKTVGLGIVLFPISVLILSFVLWGFFMTFRWFFSLLFTLS